MNSETSVKDKDEDLNKPNPLGTEKIGKLIWAYALPSVISLVVQSIYNMVDQVFIGRGVGYMGNAATNIIMPMNIIVISIGLLVGNGAASFMSLELGKGDHKRAAKGVGNMLILTAILAVVFIVAFEVFLRPLCVLFGGQGEVLEYAMEYGRMIAIGFPALGFTTAFGAVLRADGRPKENMIGMLIGCITNIFLDPIFIFVCGWGVMGAGLATIIGQYLCAIFFFLCIFRFKTIKLTKEVFRLNGRIMGKFLSLGLSSFITQFAMVIVMAVQNNLFVKYGALSVYGADIPLAAFSIVSKTSQLLMSIALGISTGVQPIWGYNYGAEKYDRVKRTFWVSLWAGVIVMVLCTLVFELFPVQLTKLFGEESDLYMEFAVKCFRIYLAAIIMVPFNLAGSNFLQSVGRPVLATVTALIRPIVVLVPANFILGAVMGVMGLLWAGPVADGLSGLASIVILRISWNSVFRNNKKIKQEKAEGADAAAVQG